MHFLRTLFASATLFAASAQAGGNLQVLPGVSVNPNIFTAGGALVNINLFANVLGAQNCSSNAVVGVNALLAQNPLVSICTCIQVVASMPTLGACPTCTANASPICASNTCGCQCNLGYYAYTDSTTGAQKCAPTENCSLPNKLIQLVSGQSSCVCGKGWVSDGAGGCLNVCLNV
ncbi:hypothetical protein T439DRAFT_321710 [Meredithblackwellia eburnea MCA 4105]